MARMGDVASVCSRLNGACNKPGRTNERRRSDTEEETGTGAYAEASAKTSVRESRKRSQKKTMKTRAKLRDSDTGGRAKVKRIVMLLSVAALMVVMMAMSVAPPFATSTYTCQSQYGTHSGVSKEAVKNSTFYFDCVKERKNV